MDARAASLYFGWQIHSHTSFATHRHTSRAGPGRGWSFLTHHLPALPKRRKSRPRGVAAPPTDVGKHHDQPCWPVQVLGHLPGSTRDPPSSDDNALQRSSYDTDCEDRTTRIDTNGWGKVCRCLPRTTGRDDTTPRWWETDRSRRNRPARLIMIPIL